ncbi:hypothetical protein MNBD_ALPHA09-1436 [hydrothermal vent metagenome]|uniref:HTH arsR-type domain-containing protein n=1 Tax=hydrothermal vent metagenome TaxID=652676 RepID=A0A3B0T7D4_9ZZZZ
MNNSSASIALSALGHQARLQVYRLLVQAGEVGLNVGEIGSHIGLPPSTLAHHLKALADAGLIFQSRRGRQVVSCVNYALMTELLAFLTKACCAGVGPVSERMPEVVEGP